MTAIDESRIRIILGVERAALAMRYLAYAIFLAVIAGAGTDVAWDPLDVAVITIVVLFHSLYSHWVLFTKRYAQFSTPLNFFIYLFEACLVVKYSGGDDSELWVVFVLMTVGYGAYAPRFRKVFLAALCYAVAYGLVLAAEAVEVGIRATPDILAARFLFIVFAGWLVGRISHLLGRAENEVRDRALAMASAEATQRAIFNSAADPIVVYRADEIIVEVNDRACEFFRVPRDEFLGQRLRRFVFDDGTLSSKASVLRSRGEYRGEMIVIRSDGEERTVDFVTRGFIRDSQRYFVVIAHDITEKKELEEATREATQNLERLNRELRQVDQLRTGFLAAMAQKLRGPLAPLFGYLDDLLSEDLGELQPDQLDALHGIRRSANRVLRTIDEALDINQPAPAPQPEPVHHPSDDDL